MSAHVGGYHDGEKHEEESLTTILSVPQRTQLTLLLAEVTAVMRQSIENNFDASANLPPDTPSDTKKLNPNIDPEKADKEHHERECKLMEQRVKELSAPKMKELEEAILGYFDSWRVGMIKRIGEVVNTPSKAKAQLGEPSISKSQASSAPDKSLDINAAPSENDEDETSALLKLYSPISTPLLSMEKEQRILILHSMLLLLLSLEHYSAYSRILLLYLTSSLHLPLSVLRASEESTAHSLLSAAKEMSGNAETKKKADENSSARAWKVGFATVAGAAVIGITGGLAAPLVAAGVGSVMGGLGLGATAAAGYLGSVAGSSVLVGSLFGAYGGRMGGQMMDQYAKEVQDFAFLPVRSDVTKKRHLLLHKSKEGEEAAGKEDAAIRRLRVTIGISGWLTEKEEVVTPWRVIGHGAEVFALRFELEALMMLGNAMTSMVGSAAWGYAKKEVLKRTILAEMMLAMWPIGLLKISRVVDNPFSVAKARSDKAGEVLADALINRAQGERPVTLVGYSLGARVVYTCLMSLARRRAFGLIESVVLIGTPAPSDAADWRTMRSVVAGRVVNVFSENDYVLGFLYRTSSIQLGVAGLQKVEGVPGVENVDVSASVSGHLRYRFLVGSLLKGIGFEDVVVEEVETEEEALRVLREKENEEKERENKGRGEKGPEKEADELEKEVEEKTRKTMLRRVVEGLHISGGAAGDEEKEHMGHEGTANGKEEPNQQSYLQMASKQLHLS